MTLTHPDINRRRRRRRRPGRPRAEDPPRHRQLHGQIDGRLLHLGDPLRVPPRHHRQSLPPPAARRDAAGRRLVLALRRGGVGGHEDDVVVRRGRARAAAPVQGEVEGFGLLLFDLEREDLGDDVGGGGFRRGRPGGTVVDDDDDVLLGGLLGGARHADRAGLGALKLSATGVISAGSVTCGSEGFAGIAKRLWLLTVVDWST